MGLACLSKAHADGIDLRRIYIAEYAILHSLISGHSPRIREDCQTDQPSCNDTTNYELGFTILTLDTSGPALRALLELIRYNMDAGISETYFCDVVERGQAAYTLLPRLNLHQLRQRCLIDMQYMRRRLPLLLAGVEDDNICASYERMAESRKELLDALAKHVLCTE